jgi:prephenate dehydratase
MSEPQRRVAYFGPAGTFTEEALLTQGDLATGELVACGSIADVLDAVDSGDCALGFVPLENAIEGTVNATIDGLVFDVELRIIREVVLDIHLNLMALPQTSLQDIDTVVSFPHALAQCRTFLTTSLPRATTVAANSTADAAKAVGEQQLPRTAAIAPRLAAELYGLELLAEAIEDHPDNQTRFVAVMKRGVPKRTGHDRTAIVCFQDADRPGSLYAILGQFAARNINLTRLESRPTKKSLGDYCFIIEFDGHVADPLIADCLAEMAATVAKVKFLGSYPVAGLEAASERVALADQRVAARQWVDHLLTEAFEIS